MKRLRLVLILVACASLSVCVSARTTNADTIYINLGNLQLQFNNQQIFDADYLAGGNGLTSEATELGSFTCYKTGGSPVEDPSASVYADILIDGIPPIVSPDEGLGYVNNTNGGYIDLLLDGNQPLLRMSIGEMDIFMNIDGVCIMGQASMINAQNLPGGLIIDPNDLVSITLNCDAFFDDNDPLRDSEDHIIGFERSTGTADITGTAVPEPSSLTILLCLAASALVARRFVRA